MAAIRAETDPDDRYGSNFTERVSGSSGGGNGIEDGARGGVDIGVGAVHGVLLPCLGHGVHIISVGRSVGCSPLALTQGWGVS